MPKISTHVPTVSRRAVGIGVCAIILVAGSIAIASADESVTRQRTFGGYACKNLCDVHADGYKWARDRNIKDKHSCKLGISPGFREGCIAFVEHPDLDPESDDQGNAVGASVTY
jgi:hypothetical protein